MENNDKSVDLNAGVGDVGADDTPNPNLEFSSEDMESINEMIKKSATQPVTESENVAEEEGVSETSEEPVDDVEPEQETVVEESSEEEQGTEFYSEDELSNLLWEDVDESRVPPGLKGQYSSMKKVFYKTKERDAEARRRAEESQARIEKLEKLLVEKEEREARAYEQAQERERLRQLDELDPDERFKHELDSTKRDSKKTIEQLKQEIQQIRVDSFYEKVDNNIEVAIANLGVKDDGMIRDLKRDAQAELPEAFQSAERAGLRPDIREIPKKVVKKVYDKYISAAKKLIETSPEFESVRNKWGKDAVSKVIEAKKKGPTVAKASPSGGAAPKKEPELPTRITEKDYMKSFDDDPRVQKILQEARQTKG